MFSYIISFVSSIFSKNKGDQDEDKEDFLAEKLLELEVSKEFYEDVNSTDLISDANCFERTGIVTYIDDGNYILIDGILYCDISLCSFNIKVNDKVLYLAYSDQNDRIVVVKILCNQGITWGEEESFEENKFNILNHIIVGEVDYREDRYVFIKDSDLKFSLDNVEARLVPVKGDWLELNCRVQWNENKPCDISAAQVLQVISIRPLRSKIINGTVTEWSGHHGTINRNIYFDLECLEINIHPTIGTKVITETVESNQGRCTWRAVKLLITDFASTEQSINTDQQIDEEEKSLIVEKEKQICVTYPLIFEEVKITDTADMKLVITNNSDNCQFINKWIILSKKRDSQVHIDPILTNPKKLYPKASFTFTITCQPKFLGDSKECLIIMFRGFQAKRYIHINIKGMNYSVNNISSFITTENEKIDSMLHIRKNSNRSFVPGVKPFKNPPFVPVKLGNFTIPDKIWSAVLGDSDQSVYSSEYSKIINRIEEALPCLTQKLSINNYIDKWHTLLYMEEIQSNINMRKYDMQKVFLTHNQEYLGIEIKDLAEQRPSLIKGDRVVVKDCWNASAELFEGFIHQIKGDLVLMKFNLQFHEKYGGSEVSIEFHSTRLVFRKSHRAINLSITNLGPNVLFPCHISSRPSKVSSETISQLKWFNETLNQGQKNAVINILTGETRPLPYLIFGPPGTGKTVTVIETILQILTTQPDSRILVATPSNSAANVITQGILQYRTLLTNSIIRIIANYLVDSDNIPEEIKPFCATIDIAKENTIKSRHTFQNGMNLYCQTSFFGRHRVTIGTCYCLGTLAQIGLPKGHFSHVIVDEAGQATEPEIMIPITFIDKENGQIILAGDPLQLGPVVMSKYCIEFGMDESFMARLLQTFPYQKDYAAFKSGYDQRVITKLTDNYRSLEEILVLPSKMFYDNSLLAKINRNQTWISNITDIVNEMFKSSDKSSGGIYVYGIRGCNTRSNESPSWYNPQEASMVALTTCKLYKKNIKPNDIGIISPYIAQVKYLRLVFEGMGLPLPKIGSVEEFQGQEKPIILITTVRSTETYLLEDQRHTLGFVKNPKRLNVALTRAQVASILFCDPHLLCKDVLWNKVINYAVNKDRYMGCDLPCCIKSSYENYPIVFYYKWFMPVISNLIGRDTRFQMTPRNHIAFLIIIIIVSYK